MYMYVMYIQHTQSHTQQCRHIPTSIVESDSGKVILGTILTLSLSPHMNGLYTAM